ncbi:uncharacterized protein L969DRAFT_82165 [Mixia osmundae IAM 14324]|uniref:uncharacterized protein n=1 Tax=Mixia osmundae (strain CBS 9802 / IAM 14324 / JCM 22182 / KY 12970) TaxID=764103 RepID=UPI0004A55920|nr:uncharacterized protein L969DRAFT_82165 [Mixia osmundae IAM 14324]KEI39356.1 hypothetical protein L969DRAFT_82165 [Mixia osmundae IAM 14324]
MPCVDTAPLPLKEIASGREMTSELSSPEDRVCLLEWLTASFVSSLISLAGRRTLEESDLWTLSPYLRHRALFEIYRCVHDRAGLVSNLARANALDLMIDISLRFITSALSLTRPVLLQQILDKLQQNSSQGRINAVLFAALILTLAFVEAEADLMRSWHSRRAYERTRGVLIAKISAKALTRKATTYVPPDGDRSGSSDTGRIVNLMSADAYSVAQLFWDISSVVTSPFELTLAILLLYRLMGRSALIGLAILLVIYLANQGLARQNLKIRRLSLLAKDRRLGVVTEFLENVRLLKLLNWQQHWVAKVQAAREEELRWRLKQNVNEATISSLWGLTTPAIVVLAFYFYTQVDGHKLSVSVAFPALSLLATAQAHLIRLPQAVLNVFQTLISVRRLEAYFAEADRPEPAMLDKADNRLIVCTDTTLAFATSAAVEVSKERQFRLEMQGLIVEPQSITVITGNNGSGKTSVLLAILNELECVKGSLRRRVDLKVAYAPAQPFLQQGTIRSNILFGEPYLPDRLKACNLLSELDDQQIIGDKGLSLSGGQQARLGLSRALYSSAELLLFDDPISAVDPATAARIINLLGSAEALMNGRAVVMTTHHASICLPIASQHWHADDGIVRKIALGHSTTTSIAKARTVATDDNELATAAVHSLIRAEVRATGRVAWNVYAVYLRAAGSTVWILTAILLLSTRFGELASSWFLKAWAESQATDSTEWLREYCLIVLSIAILGLLKMSIGYVSSYRAARSLFQQAADTIADAPVLWLLNTPLGQVINRFTSDVNVVDGSVNGSLRNYSATLINFASSLIVIILAQPWFLLPATAIVAIYTWLARPYISASRDLRRLEMKNLSPLFSSFASLLKGVTTIRAFGTASRERFQSDMLAQIDAFQLADHLYWSANQFLSFRFDLLGDQIFFAVVLIAALSKASAGIAAFASVSAQLFVSSVHSLVWDYANLQLDLSAMERIQQLLKTDQEASSAGHAPPAYWPSSSASLAFDNVSLAYSRKSTPVLQNVSFTVQPRTKVAIVGETGAGKSSLLLSLVGAIELAQGTIHVDGLNLSRLDVRQVRERISYVHQASEAFTGTVRDNIDPFEESSDVECRRILSRVCLGELALDQEISGGGDKGLSRGKCQLLNIARALLRRNNIVILDEATSNLDNDTDELVCILADVRTHPWLIT